MKFKIRLQDEDLSEIENILKEHLTPVHPRSEFVAGLRHRLSKVKPEPPVLPRGWRTFIFSTAGIFSGLLIVGAVVRAIAGLIGMLNLVRQVKPTKAKGVTSPTPA